MPELIANLHIHSVYSDGHATPTEIARVALNSPVDVVLTSDHNIYVSGIDKYLQNGKKKVLLLAGEEVHNNVRKPQKSHMLVFGANRELSIYAANPQNLIDQATQSGAVTFIAHPIEKALALFGEADFSWDDWDVQGFTGLELWNGLSELKNVIHSRLTAIFFVFFPQYIARGPLPAVLQKWDDLTSRRKKVVAVGGADAHAMQAHLGPLRRTIFPYKFHFHSINTHLIVPSLLSGDLNFDRHMIYDAMRKGHCFIGHDLPHLTNGFSFTASGKDQTVVMGDEINLGDGLTLQIKVPIITECRLIRDGQLLKTWKNREIISQTIRQPGVYRVECYLHHHGMRRAWIFSNPIYVL